MATVGSKHSLGRSSAADMASSKHSLGRSSAADMASSRPSLGQQFRGGHGQQQAFARQQVRGGHGQQQAFARQQFRGGHGQQQAFAHQQFANNQFADAPHNGFGFHGGDRFRVNTDFASRYYGANGRGMSNGCPPGLWAKNNGCMPPGQAQRMLGAPLGVASGFAALNALSPAMSYLYPDTPDYYYRYGDGYLYQVDRGDNLIAALMPLLAGGYLPGQYLPQLI